MCPSLTGRLIGSRYRVAEVLGTGGMGIVYRAVDERLQREVALKVLPHELQHNPERLRRFTNEARAASSLNHPNILTVHEVGDADGSPFIAMELIEGETLRHRLSTGPMLLEDALDLALQVASGLGASHDKGVVHRDLKPENVMVRRDGFAKIVDFGLATLRPDLSNLSMMTTGAFEPTGPTVVGTLAYMSPEQIDGRPVDRRSDVMSFAVVLCEMVTGINPFARPTVVETLNAIAQTPASVATAIAALPPALAPVIGKALELRPEDRYQSIAEVIVDLRRIRRLGDDVAGRRVAADSGEVRRARRYHRPFLGAVVVAVVAAIAAGAYFVTSRAAGARIDSIAVLPFVNPGGNPDTEYLSQGMARHIVNALSGLEDADLRVVPWSTVSTRYAGKDPLEVGRTLGVSAVVTGIVTPRPDSLDIQIELIDVVRAAQIWGQQYRPKLVEVLAAERRIARDLSERLRVATSLDQRERLSRLDTDNPQAHLLYLKGRNQAEKVTVKEAQQAVQYFQQAIALDPDYVAAHAGLSSASAVVAFALGRNHESATQARSAAVKALELDNSSAEAHFALGRVHQLDWNWTGADQEFKTAAALSPTFVDAHHYHSHILSALGRHEESLAATERALNVDPLDPLMNAHRAWWELYHGHLEAATARAMKSLELGETYFAHVYLARAYAQIGRYDESLTELRRAQEMSPANPDALASIGYVYARSERAGEARKILDEMDMLSKQREIPLGLKALVYVGLGQKELALKWLEYAFAERSGFLRDLMIDERWTPLRADPRFTELVNRVGLRGSPTAAGSAVR